MRIGRILLVATLAWAGPGGSPAAAATSCAPPAASETQPGYLVADPRCDPDGTPFTALPGATVHTGIADGAAYRIEVPESFNGRLVVYAHGYRGDDKTVHVDNPALRAHYIDEGFAWAASSYQTNGYDVGQGVRDSHAMIDLFRRVTGLRTRSVVLSGASMGGHITAVAIERYPHAFDGAMPYCGVLADTELFDYFLDAGVTAAALAGVRTSFPVTAGEWTEQAGRITPALGLPSQLTRAGRTWSGVVERRSGGDRPGFDASLATWNATTSDGLPFLFSVYPGTSGGTIGIADGNVTGNRLTYYRSTDRRLPTAEERRLNADVLRVTPTDRASRGLEGIPAVEGRPSVPVVSLHDIGDLFVPFSMEQIYAARTAAHGRAGLFVSRAVRGTGHCDFTQPELQTAFDDLISWLDTGHRPAGDAIRDPHTVAAADFGCRFTVGTRPEFAAC